MSPEDSNEELDRSLKGHIQLLRTLYDEETHWLGSLWPTALQSEVYYHVARGSPMDLSNRALIRALAINQVDACSALYSNRTEKKTLVWLMFRR